MAGDGDRLAARHTGSEPLSPTAGCERVPNRSVAPLDPSVCRAASGTGRHPTDEWLWNGRGQRCEFRSISVTARVDSAAGYPQELGSVP